MGAISQNNGTLVGELLRYEPFGDARGTQPSSDITDRGFTGHRENRDIGLTYMNARYYVGEVGRFASADTLVPDPQNPQSFNCYAYVNNSPLKYTDPSGHYATLDVNDEHCYPCVPPKPALDHSWYLDQGGADDKWDEIMARYQNQAADFVGDYVFGGGATASDVLSQLIKLAGNGHVAGEAQFFDMIGKSADGLGLAASGLNAVTRMIAIHMAYWDPEAEGILAEISIQELDYFYMRAAYEPTAAGMMLGFAAGAGAVTGGAGAAIVGATDLGITMYTDATGKLSPDERLARDLALAEMYQYRLTNPDRAGTVYRRLAGGSAHGAIANLMTDYTVGQ